MTFTLSTHPHPPEFGHEPTDHAGCSVHTGVRVEPEDTQALERLARYILRPPISLERMQWDGRGEVSYRRKTGHDGVGSCAAAHEVLDPLDFLARVIMHIPEPRRHLVRYYGAYSQLAGSSACGQRLAPMASRLDAR